jgi:hypothetical protein
VKKNDMRRDDNGAAICQNRRAHLMRSLCAEAGLRSKMARGALQRRGDLPKQACAPYAAAVRQSGFALKNGARGEGGVPSPKKTRQQITMPARKGRGCVLKRRRVV